MLYLKNGDVYFIYVYSLLVLVNNNIKKNKLTRICGYYCCQKNNSNLPRLQNEHSLRPCASISTSTNLVPWRFFVVVCW